MSGNTLGTLFCVTSFGESHGPAIGCVVDGCPPGLALAEADIQVFADALADSLMQRYGSSLLDLNAKLKVRVKSETPLRGGTIVKVSSEYLRQGAEPVPVDYLMRKVGTQWKAFDVMVEGVSFVQTFRTQFDGPLKRKTIPQVAADIKAGKLQATAN